MIYKKLKEIKKYDQIIQIWNNEWSSIYPLTSDLLMRNLQNVCKNASFVAIENDEIVGFIIGKVWNDKYNIPDYEKTGWISLIYVTPSFRKLGIGSYLLNLVESEFKKLNKEIIHIGKDYYNFFPGLPVDMKSSYEWFKKRGFERPYDTFDLIRIKNKDILPLVNCDYEFRQATKKDKDALIEFLTNNWPGRWTKEAIDYFNEKGTGKEYLLCMKNGCICAFAKIGFPNTKEQLISYGQTWRYRFDALGSIGPLGVDKDYRKKHLGYDIVAYATNLLNSRGCQASEIIIDWTGLLDFYRPMGYEVWKSYYYLTKKIEKEKKEDEI